MVPAWGDSDGTGVFNLNGARNITIPLIVEIVCDSSQSQYPILKVCAPMMTNNITGVRIETPTELQSSSNYGSGLWDCSNHQPTKSSLFDGDTPQHPTQYSGYFNMDLSATPSGYIECDWDSIVQYTFETSSDIYTLIYSNIFPGGATAQVLYTPPATYTPVVVTTGLGIGSFVKFPGVPSPSNMDDNWDINLRNCYPGIVSGLGVSQPFYVSTTIAPQPAVEMFGRAEAVFGQTWAASGGVNIGGTFIPFVNISYVAIVGLSITMGGSVVMMDRFGAVMIGGVNVGGQAITESIVPHWEYTTDISYGIDVEGESIICAYYSYSTPTLIPYVPYIQIGGTCGRVYQGVAYVSSGDSSTGRGVQIGGQFFCGPYYSHIMSGGVTVVGYGDSKCSNLGEFDMSWGGSVQLIFAEFAADPNSLGTLPQLVADDPTLSQCSCTAPAAMTLTQNIAQENALSNFMGLNGLSIPNSLPLLYSNGGWQANVHFEAGFGDSLERWNIVFEWACDQIIAAQDLGSPLWKFGMLVTRTTTTFTADTRLLLTYAQPTPCPTGGVNFSISFDTQAQVATPASVYEVLSDDIGLFNTPYWSTNPSVNFSIE